MAVPGAAPMKRDMDLVRALLLDIEAERINVTYNDLINKTGGVRCPELDNLIYNGKIIIDAGFAWPVDNDMFADRPAMLTWAGCDFLDTIRDDDVWRKTKAGASKAAGAGFGFIVELAKAYAKAELTKLGLPLG